MIKRSFFLVVAASAIDAAASGATLALATCVILSCTHVIDHSLLVALLSLDDVNGVAVSLLVALGFVSTVTVSAGVRHDLSFLKKRF